jgi:mannose-6-phosphate isomerase-like protein (cupin superfamily)
MPESRAVHSRNPATYFFLGVRMRILLASEQTNAQFSLIEGVMPPGGDGGLHVQHREDETMHLLEGALEITIGERVFMLEEGESYFAPRSVPHRVRNLGMAAARSLLITTPGGFDAFITQAGERVISGAPQPEAAPPSPGQIAKLLELARRFGIEIIAPPGS